MARRKVRVGDGTGVAVVLEAGDELTRVGYRSGATRFVATRNVAKPGEPTPAEREILLELLEAKGGSIEKPGWQWRTAIEALGEAGYLVEEGRALVLTEKGERAAEKLGPAKW